MVRMVRCDHPHCAVFFSFFTASGTGFEAFFTTDGMLVVAVCTKKDYMTVALPEVAFNDSSWVSDVPVAVLVMGDTPHTSCLSPQHCIDIVHVAGRRPFGQNVVSIYADGHLRKTAQLRFPSLHEVRAIPSTASSCSVTPTGN